MSPLMRAQAVLACHIVASVNGKQQLPESIDEVEVEHLGDGDNPRDAYVALHRTWAGGKQTHIRHLASPKHVPGLGILDWHTVQAPFVNENHVWSVKNCRDWLANNNISCDTLEIDGPGRDPIG